MRFICLFNMVMAAHWMIASSGWWHWMNFTAACVWTWLLWSYIRQDYEEKNDGK